MQTFVDEGIHLAGIEITVIEQETTNEEPAEQKLFISIGELYGLLQALQGDLAVYFEQFNWSDDWT